MPRAISILRRRLSVTITAACALLPSAGAFATQHLIDAGKDWQKITEMIRPGDEVLLLPGEHKQAVLDGWHGSAEKPITIRGLDPANPPVFRAPIALLNPRHLVLENLIFDRCEHTAILLGPGAAASDIAGGDETIGYVTIRNLRITNTGTKPSARVIEISGLSNVFISDCAFSGWSGRAVDVVGCRDVTISGCTFTGMEKYDPELTVAVRGGSRDVTITSCRFERAGQMCAISLGGRTPMAQFADASVSSDTSGQLSEASQCRIVECYFIDQPCPVLMAHADRCAVRSCTIVRPQRFVFALLSLQASDRIARNRRPTFGSNLIVWTAGELTGIFRIDQANRGVDLVLESNLWWSEEPAEARGRLVPTIGADIWPQTLDVNPRLDERHRPKNDAATMFGVRAAD